MAENLYLNGYFYINLSEKLFKNIIIYILTIIYITYGYFIGTYFHVEYGDNSNIRYAKVKQICSKTDCFAYESKPSTYLKLLN